MSKKWIVANSNSIGLRHIEAEIPCQDASEVYLDAELGYGIAVVSDGAGSASCSDIGSSFICSEAIKIIKDTVQKKGVAYYLHLDPFTLQSVFVDCYKELYDRLLFYSQSIDIPLKSLAATVIILVFSEEGVICSHIGDGRAGYQDIQGNWFSILEPYKGEEANQTIFITSDIWSETDKYIRTKKVISPIQSFTLMSDGCENATFELIKYNEDSQIFEKLNIPYALFFNPNVLILRELYDKGKTTEEINELWQIFLDSGNPKFEFEPDDKTLILGTLTSQNLYAEEL